ncbi:norsolorinic acid reductase [Xylogone sp. PMI_703]|nr:norsolorinic acid reductase [Xylogone sp. PMI_703]
MSFFPLVPTPKNGLGYHRLLSPTAAVKVSPLCLGAMNFGDAWSSFMGECNKSTVFEILDYFHSQGGNFIDTASNYQDEQSEKWVGEWMKERGVRDEMVLAGKYTMGYRYHEQRDPPIIQANFGGNNKKNMRISVDRTLAKLQTDYLDILYVHWWDYTTSIPELMQSLNDLVKAGKVLYLGISDTPAWIVSKANEYARNHGLQQFVVYQGRWSAADRDFEREILPMCQHEGMALAPWGALGGGHFKAAADQDKARGYGGTEEEKKVSAALEKIAIRKNTQITSVAMAYITHNSPYVFPIIGGRKLEHLKGNIKALEVELSAEDITEIESAVPFDLGFPHSFLCPGQPVPHNAKDVGMSKIYCQIDCVEYPKPIPPHKFD